MKRAEVLAVLRSHADPQIATILARRNPSVHAIGVRFGDLGPLAKRIGKDHSLAVALWDSGILEARFLACMIEVPAEMTRGQIAAQLKDLDYPVLTDMWANNVYRTPWAKTCLKQWTKRKGEFVRRAGFALLYDFAADPEADITDDELSAYLDQIEAEIHDSPNWAREQMNMAPIAIGIGHPKLKKKALAVTKAYGKVDVFHGDKTNCKVWNAYEALRDPKTKVKAPA